MKTRTSSALRLLVIVPILAAAACGSSGSSSGKGGNSGSGVGTAGTGLIGGSTGSGGTGGSSTTGTAGTGPGPTFGGPHPRILLNGANLDRIKATYASSPVAASFREIVSDSMSGGKPYGFMGLFSALLYRLTGDQKYATYAVSYIDAQVAAEEQLISSGMEPAVTFDSYLLVGDYIGDVAMTYDWCFDFLTDAQKKRWLAYANQAVWNVWNPDQAKWGNTKHTWSGWSIDNPHDNYYSSFLQATEYLGLAAQGDDPMADTWLDTYRNAKIRNEVDPMFTADIPAGGSREGTGYGVEMRRLYAQYAIWEQATGERIAPLTPHTEASVFWFIHQTLPTLNQITTIGDMARESSGMLFDDHRDYVQNLVYLFQDAQWAPMAQWWLNHNAVPKMTQRYYQYYDLLWSLPTAPEAPLTGLYPAYFSAGTGAFFARTDWTTKATFLHYMAGPYTESHAHHDQGAFQIFKNEWLAFDAGVLSDSGLRQDEASHNIPSVIVNNKAAQMDNGEDAKMVALADTAQYTYVGSQSAAAYHGSGGITQMDREIVWVKPDTFVIFDRVQAQNGAQKIWRMSSPAKPTVSGKVATIMGSKSKLTLTAVVPSAAAPAVVDWHATDSDFNGGYRIDIPATGDGRVYFLNVIALDGSVTTVTEASPSGKRGVTLNLADGRTVTAQFDEAAIGASLDITGGSGAAVHGALPKTVADLPRYAN